MLLRDSKRILIDATNVDISRPGGGSFCTLAYIEALLALYPGMVDVMHPVETHIRDSRYTTIDVPKRNLIQCIGGFFRGQFHRSGQFIVDYLSTHATQYDAVFLNTGLFAGGILSRISNLPIKTIVLHHNFESEYRMCSHSVLTFGGKTDWIVRYWEKKGYRLADINLFLSKHDMATFIQEYGSRTNNYVTGIFEPTTKKFSIKGIENNNSAVITCALGDTQNQASLLYFAEHYLPIFEQKLPGWHIQLMGRNPSKAIQHMVKQHESIILTPNPTDIRSIAAKSTLYLCPMDAGGGIKLRLMDGLRAGQPILTHEHSLRGYEALIGNSYFYTYNDIDSFKEALNQIILYIQSKEFSRTAIQQAYYSVFSLENGIQRLKEILENA